LDRDDCCDHGLPFSFGAVAAAAADDLTEPVRAERLATLVRTLEFCRKYVTYFSDDDRNTLVHYAAYFQNAAVMRCVQEFATSYNHDLLTAANDDGVTPLGIAQARLEDIEQQLEALSDLEALGQARAGKNPVEAREALLRQRATAVAVHSMIYKATTN
jgi:hypothetical protein